MDKNANIGKLNVTLTMFNLYYKEIRGYRYQITIYNEFSCCGQKKEELDMKVKETWRAGMVHNGAVAMFPEPENKDKGRQIGVNCQSQTANYSGRYTCNKAHVKHPYLYKKTIKQVKACRQPKTHYIF